jgi:hypothetical protein
MSHPANGYAPPGPGQGMQREIPLIGASAALRIPAAIPAAPIVGLAKWLKT